MPRVVGRLGVWVHLGPNLGPRFGLFGDHQAGVSGVLGRMKSQPRAVGAVQANFAIPNLLPSTQRIFVTRTLLGTSL
jgi:hypothetical protein